MVTGIVFNIQKFSINDGPGIRTTVFMKGCPLRCLWCHNPESNEGYPQLMFHSNLCTGCGCCIRSCPKRAITMGADGKSRTARALCDNCGLCVPGCASKAREFAGKRMQVAEVMNQVLEDKIFYDSSGGGMSVSGGEPLAQPEFTSELLQAAHKQGINTVIETSGFAPQKSAELVFPHVDLLLFDIKHMDKARHRELTGVSNRIIHENLRYAALELHKNIWIRMPLIRGVNDSEEEINAVLELLQPLREHIRRVCLLSYHSLGLAKLEAMDAPEEIMKGFQAPEKTCLEEIANRFRAQDYEVTID